MTLKVEMVQGASIAFSVIDTGIDWTHPAQRIHNLIRGFQPWPGAFTTLDGKKLIVPRMALADGAAFAALASGQPGQVHIENHRLFAACAEETWLEFLEVQLEGKKRLAAAEFLRGTALAHGARLGDPIQ